jgi:hypothetical protein
VKPGGGSGRLELGHLLFLPVNVASFLVLSVLRVLFLGAQDLGDAFGAEIGAADEPFVVGFDAEHAGESDQGLVVGEDADDVGAAADLFVDALERVRIPYETARCRL